MEYLTSSPVITFDFLTNEQKEKFREIKCLPNCQYIDCSENNITVLPELPNCQQLYCSNNKLIVLPELPNCKYLDCENNNLTYLPELPNCEYLHCDSNHLTVLPELPKCKYLYCNSNHLTVLPELPNCKSVLCFNNQLTVFPKLPRCKEFHYCRRDGSDEHSNTYYGKQFAKRFKLKYPSKGHHQYFKCKWDRCFNKVKLMRELMKISGFDEYVSSNIIQYT